MPVLKALVVDDEPGMRLGIRRVLSKYTVALPDIDEEIGFDVDLAESGEEAIEKITAKRPDVLILDYKLPTISGLDVLERVRTDDSEMVTIMITAYASLETAVSAIKRGAFDFLAKPFEPDELKKTVYKAVQNLYLARHVRQLEREKRQLRFQFISVLGHELKAPINAIEGYLNIMNDRVAGNDINAYDEMIQRSRLRIRGMRKMIADLLDLTRIESGQKKRELSEQNLAAIAKMAIETVQPSAAERNISIKLTIDDPTPMVCDPGEIEIVFNNLLSNAVKYNRDKGLVDFSVRKEQDKVVITVSDTGIGMTKEECGRLFNEFVRIKNKHTRDIPGSGLGLSILKKIAAMYKGAVNVASEPGVGTTFTVTLYSPTE